MLNNFNLVKQFTIYRTEILIGYYFDIRIMTLTKICQNQEKWNLDFYRNVVPRAILQIQNVDTLFEMLVHALSEFHHKLSLVVVQLPCEFYFKNIRNLQEKINNCASQMLTENKYQTIKLAALVKQLKQIIFDFSLEHRQSEDRIQSLQQKLQKVREQQRKHQEQYIQLQNACGHSISAIIDLRRMDLEKKCRIERNIFQKIENERLDLQKKQSILAQEYNKKMRTCFSRLNEYIDKVLVYKRQYPFETFNRNNSNEVNTTDGNVKQNQSKGPDNISQFSHDQSNENIGMKCTIEAAEQKCEKQAYWPILTIPSKMILEDAMIAISQHEQSEGSYGDTNEKNYSAKV